MYRSLLLCVVVAFAAITDGDPAEVIKTGFKDGKSWFDKAGDTQASMNERNQARKKAWTILWPAREALDRVGETNPGRAASLEREFGDIRMMVHWLKKESPVGLLESTGIGPKKVEPGSMLDWGPKPEPSPGGTVNPEPSKGAKPTPEPTPGAMPVKPPPPAKVTIESRFAAAAAYEKAHRFDLPGIHELYVRVLTEFPDPTHDLFFKAAERAGALESRLKDAYKVLRDEDPDILKGMGNARIKSMVITVAKDLRSSDEVLRTRAARLLGQLGRREGVPAIVRAMKKEKVEGPAMVLGESLFLIGGADAADALTEFRDDGRYPALDLLIRIANRSPVDRRMAVTRLAVFARARSEAKFDTMVRTLDPMGFDGTIGLAKSLEYCITHARIIRVIKMLETRGEPAVARVFSRYFQRGKVSADHQVREEAMNAVRRMAKTEAHGEAVIPHLFEGLRHRATRFYTTQLLQELTGETITAKKWGWWSKWWRKNHPGWSEKADAERLRSR